MDQNDAPILTREQEIVNIEAEMASITATFNALNAYYKNQHVNTCIYETVTPESSANPCIIF